MACDSATFIFHLFSSDFNMAQVNWLFIETQIDIPVREPTCPMYEKIKTF